MSAPRNGPHARVNEMVPLEPLFLYYASVDHAIQLIKVADLGAQLAKADITDAFKTMPLFNVKWQSKFYFALRLSFGCRSSRHIFKTLSVALCWIMQNVCRPPFIIHLLYDFLLIDFPSEERSPFLDILTSLFRDLGIPLSHKKTLGPCTSLEFLGITLDSVKMQASLPQEKLIRIRSISDSFTNTVSISNLQHDLLSLSGDLNFAMRIIPQGRSFISRLLTLGHSHYWSDLHFWALLLINWNAISYFYDDQTETPDSMAFYTDMVLGVLSGPLVCWKVAS